MDYKEKLKEALNSKATPFEVSSWIEEQFPELRKSDDAIIRNEIISALKYANYKGVHDKHIAWLEKQGKQILANSAKTCKDEQTPAWSEEDYNEIETIACHLDNTDNEGMAEVLRNIRDKYYDIIPQNTWKPSDEQMEQLLDVYNGISEGWQDSVIESLYNDLKKLREE